ncbi:MAG TPA: LLM class flavin-dependent oxidoreductase [Candidatus Limnocylindrales bacterium]|nr:LLM class flavin-dependent oxidoreductase [Candidatus Limnocylindrales bacterium]
MKLGSVHIFESPPGIGDGRAIAEQMELIVRAEELGYDSAWIAEHHFSDYGVCGSPAVIMAAAAARTHRIRLASAVSVLSLHHPVRLAEEFALLDHLSDGRVEMGVGRGYQQHEFAGYGVDPATSRERFHESLELMKRLWTEPQVTHDGRYWKVAGASLRPRPLQRPHPPLWMACLSPASFEPCGRDGYHLLCAPVFGFDPAGGAAQVGDWRAGLRKSRIAPESREVGALVITYVADTRAAAEADLKDHVLWYYRTLAAQVAAAGAPSQGYETYAQARDFLATVDWDTALRRNAVICGNPDDVAAQIDRIRRACGITTYLAWTRIGGLPVDKATRSMELLSQEVLPQLNG